MFKSICELLNDKRVGDKIDIHLEEIQNDEGYFFSDKVEAPELTIRREKGCCFCEISFRYCSIQDDADKMLVILEKSANLYHPRIKVRFTVELREERRMALICSCVGVEKDIENEQIFVVVTWLLCILMLY